MSRRRSLTSTARIIRDDYRCPPADGSPSRGEPQRDPRNATRLYPQVVDDFPAVVPVTQREMDVLETYLGSLLDDMLKRTH
jgi:hypothetical protein